MHGNPGAQRLFTRQIHRRREACDVRDCAVASRTCPVALLLRARFCPFALFLRELLDAHVAELMVAGADTGVSVSTSMHDWMERKKKGGGEWDR